jgi:thiol-disulfide isomerase/thioredoxin
MPKHQMTKPILSLIAYVAMALFVAYVLIDRHPPTLAVGTVAPIDEKMGMLYGGKTTVRRLLYRPMVINFWASWCPACLKEMPILSKLAKKYRSQMTFLGPALASDIDDIVETKKRFLLDYELVIATDDVVEKWQARVLPTTYVIDQQGTIRWAQAGVVSEAQLEQAIRMVLGR